MPGHESYGGGTGFNALSEQAMLDVLEQDKDGRWFELSFIDTTTVENKPSTVATAIQKSMRPLADYAQRFNAYFLATVETSPEGLTKYTIMPAYKDKQIAEKASEYYKKHLQTAWAHIVIDGDQEDYTDSEQLGIWDDFLRDGTYAFDVSTNNGIRSDKIEVARASGIAREQSWVEWSGHPVTTSDNELFGPGDARLHTSPPDIFSGV